MQPTLVVLAAGMGSRCKGLKQVEPVGPSGETIIDYSVFDALRAGFDKLIFIIRRDIHDEFKATIGKRFENRIAVEYVFQELDRLPPGFTVPAGAGPEFTDEHVKTHPLTGDEIVSMNMSGFTPDIFPQLDRLFVRFLKIYATEPKREFYIPSAVNTLITENAAKVKVLRTPD